MNLTDKKVFITGGSAGIGKALIEELSNHGVEEIAVMGRTAEKLDALEEDFPSVEFLKIQGDISQLDHIKSAVQKVKEEWGTLDMLINNAGVVSAGLLEEISDEDIIDQVNINVTGLILLTKHMLSLLKETSEGALINISSGLGYIGMPFYSVYAATKAAVKHFSEAMRRELSDYPIHVMTIYPTATDTAMMETAKVDDMDSPKEVAKATVDGLINKEIEVILGGEKQRAMVTKNMNEPLKVDEQIKDQFDAIRKRAEEHRSM
ncbi:SDR family NAD(P)-dependent oxidoreductase [Fodinibius sp.]|uniref:SDR family NAD(P)-dependent oxidoreductase n=1 Tax=Fodinibius sp. TaxID=1872440 RepID=UPI002ACE5D72|nr:SDR family NAD(P)-dependent oxidoreductase [Fodinibius sp.]MDZ7659024.1 SDR family NAD(P)-dependent oxidoreductase [Fodinibius sp.]